MDAPALDAASTLPLDVVLPTAFGVVFAYATALYCGAMVVFAWLSHRWPTTEGVVVESQVEDLRRGRGRRGPPSYSVRTRYRYEVGGRTYVGGRVLFGGAFSAYTGSTLGSAPVFTPGAHVTVRYLSAFPGVCTLQSKTTWQMGLFAVLGTLAGSLWLGQLFP